jgi:LysM repeat protein
MRNARYAVSTVIAWFLICGMASASTPHTVQPGETLWSIAAADGLSPSALAAANGMSPDAHVVSGATIQVPAATTTATTTTTTPAAAPTGAHTVLPGETLSGIAARAGVSVDELASMNGLSADGVLVSGTALRLPSGGVASPSPTPQSVTSTDVRSVAASNGVPASLAAAIGWQESGFNNAMVSSASARGVMQVTPGTWQWVQQNLASSPLDPSSSSDNVKAGVLYLRQLLRDTGGDEARAAAAYYQGLGSLQTRGMLPATRRYVANVMALRSRFGGP